MLKYLNDGIVGCLCGGKQTDKYVYFFVLKQSDNESTISIKKTATTKTIVKKTLIKN